jgi:hypothetical protein
MQKFEPKFSAITRNGCIGDSLLLLGRNKTGSKKIFFHLNFPRTTKRKVMGSIAPAREIFGNFFQKWPVLRRR